MREWSEIMAKVSMCILAVFLASPCWPEAKDVDIIISNDCEHSVDTERLEVEGKDNDVVWWRVRSRCTQEQKVAICFETANPFHGCVSVPGGHDVGVPFPVTDRKRVVLYCAPKYAMQQTFKFDIHIGPAASCDTGSATSTRTAGHPEVKVLTHKLDIVVVP